MSFRQLTHASLADLRTAFFDLLTDTDDLKAKLAQADNSNLSLYTEANALEAELKSTKAKLQEAWRDVEDLEQENFDLQESLVDLEQEMNHLLNPGFSTVN